MLKITLKKSAIGYDETQKATVKALGLRKMHASTLKPDNPQIRGMIKKINHLVEVEQVAAEAPGGNASETE